MFFKHEISQPASQSQVSVFSLPYTDTTFDNSLYLEYKPVVNVQDSDGKIDFRAVGNSSQYLDLNDSFLYLRIKVVNQDGSDLHRKQDISTSNLLLHSLFSQCDLYINSRLVSTSNNCYGYKAYIQTLFSYGSKSLQTIKSCALYYEETNNGSVDDANEGYKNRKAYVSSSKACELIDKLCLDLSEQERYVLSDTDVTISLTRSPDAFVLLGKDAPVKIKNAKNEEEVVTLPGTAKVKILDASFFVRKQILYPSI